VVWWEYRISRDLTFAWSPLRHCSTAFQWRSQAAIGSHCRSRCGLVWTSSRHEDCAMSLKLPLPIPVDGDVERGNEIVDSTLLPPFPRSQPCTSVYAIVDPANSL
jgi:hypothetical protein